MSGVIARIKTEVGIDDTGHCACCDVSNCCGALPEALNEIMVLQKKLDTIRKMAEPEPMITAGTFQRFAATLREIRLVVG